MNAVPAQELPGVAVLIGLTLASVVVSQDDDEIIFTTTEGRRFRMCHHRDCCESVIIESVVGDVFDLLGEPITLADESSSEETPAGVELTYVPDSQTWTFYRIGTRKGQVDIRWHGESNGYYSEAVSFDEITN